MPDRSRRHDATVIVHDPSLPSPERSSPLEPGLGAAGPVGDEVVERLRRAHDVEELDAEARRPRVEERRGELLSGGDAQPERGEIVAARRVLDLQEARVHRRHREEQRGLLYAWISSNTRSGSGRSGTRDRRGPHARGK